MSGDRPDADAARRDLGEVLSLLAHDLKNPLAAVLTNLGFIAGVVEDLDEGAADVPALGDAREAIVDARLACDSMQRFVANLELVARDAAGRTSLAPDDPTPLDLVGLVDELARKQHEVALGRRLNVVVEPAKPTYARADRELVLRAVDNVLSDALQHAPAGSTVTIVVGSRGPRESKVEIRDSGPVVPAEMRAQVGTAAGQILSKGRTELRYGRGLALYAASLAASLARGRLEIGEAEGRSAIAVVVPRHEDA